MGLNSSNSESKIYLNIVGGKISRRFKEHQTENGKQVTIEREIKDKETGAVIKTVIERHYDSIDAYITGASIDKEGKFGIMLVFELTEGDENFTLQFPLDSNYGRSILYRVPKLDPTRKVVFKPYNFESKEEMNNNGKPKKIVGVNLFYLEGQVEEKIMPVWTKENPGKLPAWEQKEGKLGKVEWDNTKQINFLAKHFEAWAAKIKPFEPTGLKAEVDMDGDLSQEVEFAKETAKKAAKGKKKAVEIEDDVEIDEELGF